MSAAASTVEQARTATERRDAVRAEMDAKLAQFARQVLFHEGPWTVEEFLELPEWGARIELLDGSLLMSPGPAGDHQEIMWNLVFLLKSAAPDDWNALSDMNVRLGPESMLRPDVLLITHMDHLTSYQPADVALAVEIVSPGSKRKDRKTKLNEYSDAGIEWFMRVEPKGVNAPVVVVYRLQDGVYIEHIRAHAGQTLEMLEPVKLSFDPAVLLHRRPWPAGESSRRP